jgi:hypothetical protein
VGRKNKNITIQLNRRIDELLRIGEKKVKVNGRVATINSVQTADSYRGTANRLGEVCKSMGVRNIEDIDKGVIERYMESYRNASAWTVSREVAAANKLLGTSYTPRDFGFTQRRTYTSVKNNRGELPKSSDANNPKNQDGLYLAAVTGCRRSSITTVTANDAIRDDHGKIYAFHFCEKGGRERISLVLPSEQGNLTRWVDSKLKGGHSPDAPLVDYISKNAPCHRMRSEYARELYGELKEAKERGVDAYNGRKYELFIDRDKYDYSYNNPRFKGDVVHGFDKDVALEVSFALGHNRLDVSLYSYLIR